LSAEKREVIKNYDHRREIAQKMFFDMMNENEISNKRILEKVSKGIRWMPWLSEAKKDVTSCENLRGLANTS
jgi:hypothetical protein